MTYLRPRAVPIFLLVVLAFLSVGIMREVKLATPAPSLPVAESFPINLQIASAASLIALPGIGPVLAERIVAYRDTQGGFENIDELIAVKGIGPNKLRRIKELVGLVE